MKREYLDLREFQDFLELKDCLEIVTYVTKVTTFLLSNIDKILHV